MFSKYQWKVLDTTGLLKEPDDVGSYYDAQVININGGFNTKEEAVTHLENIKKKYNWIDDEYVLVECYYP